jgi:hypothetical protein
MKQKKLETKSRYEEYDLDKDGIVTDEELKKSQEILDQELREEKANSQKKMAWVAMGAMCIYPLLSLIIPEERLDTWSSMSDMIFLSQASVIGLYFGATAYMSRR